MSESGHITGPFYTCAIELKPSVSCYTELIASSTCCSMKFQWQLKYTQCMYRSLKQVGTDLSWKVVLACFCLLLANLLLGYILIWNQHYKSGVLVGQPWDFDHWSWHEFLWWESSHNHLDILKCRVGFLFVWLFLQSWVDFSQCDVM